MQRKTVKSASRTIEVLELFRYKRRPLRLYEIYNELNFPQSSATNLLKSLVVSGYVNYNRTTMSYLPTMKVRGLGSWLSNTLSTYDDLDWLLDEIHRQTGEAVGLVSQNDLFVQYVRIKTADKRRPTKQERYYIPPPEGAMRLMIDSSTGLVMLSQLRDRAIDKIYRYSRHYSSETDVIPDFADLMREIRWVREVGYAYVAKKPAPDLSSIAVPLDEDIHGIPLAVAVGGPADRLARNQSEILRIMQETIESYHGAQQNQAKQYA